MQSKLKFFLPVLLLLFNAPVFAQVQPGSFGDPVFTFDFGSGNTPQFPITSYTYVAGSCPNDGSYSISKTETGCHDDTWHRVLKDHTGNDGYMMVVNADTAKNKEFFRKETTIDGKHVLCGNTKYEFSAYILNLIKAGKSGFIEPKISFIIETLSGEGIGIPDTVDVHATSDPNGWTRFATYFTTPENATAVVVRMVNIAPGGNGNDLLLDDITFRAYGPNVKAIFSGDGSVSPKNVCEGTAASYDISATPAPGYNYQWQRKINDDNDWVDITDSVGTSIYITMPATAATGSYQYRLGVAAEGNINSLKCRVYTDPVIININPNPVVDVIGDRVICEGSVLTLTATGGATYKWILPDSSVTSQNPLNVPAKAGPYTVEVKSAAGCIATQTVTVTINAKPVIDMGLVQPTCKGVGVPLKASVQDPGPDTYTYSWFPTIGLTDASKADPTANPDISMGYTVTVTNNRTGCSDTRQVQVDILDVPVANAGSDKKIFEGQSVTLDGGEAGDVTYTWSPSDYLKDPHSRTPIATPPHTMPYVLTVTPANGCSIDEDQVTVTVYEKIVIPSTFTPNNDGVNDIWNIEALETYPQGTITVFTRNGKQVFQSKGYGKPWDGKLNGALLPTGTYYYVIDLKNDTPKLSGWVLLVR
jgi:gliding motility-associated-like protein